MTRAADFRTEGGVIEGPRAREIDSDLGKAIEKEREMKHWEAKVRGKEQKTEIKNQPWEKRERQKVQDR